MAQINFVLRTLVRVMYGTALLPGTRQQALASFQRAAELAPQRLIHKCVFGGLGAGTLLPGLWRRMRMCWSLAPCKSAAWPAHRSPVPRPLLTPPACMV